MKFTDLTSAQRSMLTMLCTGQTFSTEELGRGTVPKFKPDQAASSLLGMRDLGLVFSNQKPANQQYAMWKASQYGRAVFEGRPSEVVQALTGYTPGLDEGTPAAGTWVVYEVTSSTAVYTASYPNEVDAVAYASRQVDKLGRVFHVAKLVARVKPVQQPTFEIERV